jgi:LPXTG-motif cell wall-anchored protein
MIEEVLGVFNPMTSILNTKKTQNFFRMFGKKKNNKGTISATIVGLSLAGAAVFGLVKRRNNDSIQPIKNMDSLIETLNIGKNGQMPNLAALAEFSNELLPAKKENQKD